MTMSNMLTQYQAIRNFALMLIGILALCQQVGGANVGVCYGTQSSKLIPFKDAISLCNKYNIQLMRLYEPNIKYLESLRGSRTAIMLGFPNEEIPRVAKNRSYAESWVNKYINKFYNVEIKYVVVGNNISPLNNATSKYVPFMKRAIKNINIYLHVRLYGIRTIKIGIAISSADLGSWTVPNQTRFQPQFRTFIDPIVNKYLIPNKFPLFINMDIYSHYVSDPTNATLDLALLKYPELEMHKYGNLFDPTLDAMYFALKDISPEVRKLPIVVSEIGWPSAGGIGASIENAKQFSNNLIQHVYGRVRTLFGWEDPEIETYISTMFDENLRTPEYAKHFGIFNKNKRPKYPIRFYPPFMG